MKKYIIILMLSLIYNLAYSQQIEKIKGDTKFTCSQKYGLTEAINSYLLTVSYDSENLKFNTSKKQKMISYSVSKKDKKYVIGKSTEGNYSFYDIKKKQFYNIDYYAKRYLTAGYGFENDGNA